MRLSIAAIPLLLAQQAAMAHVPGSEQTLTETLNHQLFGPHHLPITAVMTVVTVALAALAIHKSVGATAKKR